ncbi:MAG: 3-isopropylmalate dehydrogenase [Saprospiraceae bacterium]|nr:3-isopropylmalate dehydrogenase [Saprospiraceae bacterium]
MSKLQNITVLKGDGIGPEVVNQAIKVLHAIAEKYAHTFTFDEQLIGASAIDQTGNPLPDHTIESCKSADAILLGAIGDPKYDNDPNATVRPEQGLLKLRKTLGLFANIRPVRIFDNLKHLSVLKPEVLQNVDMVIYRELTGGIYFGKKEKNEEQASDLCHYHRFEIERIAKLAFEEATKRRNKLCLIDKANVLDTSRLWRDVVQQMSPSYPSVEVNYLFIDNAAMQMILNPSQFDVIVTSNMFGDIISDEASVLGGSLGLLPSSSAGTEARLYEPVHGSFPQATGKNIANPLATILSIEMMLRDFGLIEEADDVLNSVTYCIDQNLLTIDLIKENALLCSEVGDQITNRISSKTSKDYGVLI